MKDLMEARWRVRREPGGLGSWLVEDRQGRLVAEVYSRTAAKAIEVIPSLVRGCALGRAALVILIDAYGNRLFDGHTLGLRNIMRTIKQTLREAGQGRLAGVEPWLRTDEETTVTSVRPVANTLELS